MIVPSSAREQRSKDTVSEQSWSHPEMELTPHLQRTAVNHQYKRPSVRPSVHS